MQRREGRTDTTLIELAYEVARDAHRDQVRRSGDPYIAHPVGVALILADLGLDDVTLAGALLHDAVEDTSVTLADLEEQFGPDVAAIVDGVTKLDRLEFDSREAQQAATMRKMLVAMAKDVRVLLIKLADRLHNMRTIASLPEAKQQRIAQETLDIYAPLAHRLGIQDVKWQLEDLAFAVLHPKRYAEIEAMVLQHAGEREKYLDDVITAVRNRLEQLHINAEVTGRPKHYWSIYEKMVVRGKEFAEINDLVGVRVTVESVKDCYGALGSIHALWRPVQGRFKDYIAMPKFNLYQSLHTTVVGPQGRPVEFQIRTIEMHRRAEYGVAAHWGYKEQRNPTEDLVWLQRIVDWQSETTDPNEFMRSLKIDLEQDEVFVFTPKGRVDHAADRRDRGRLRVRDPHRGRASLYRRARQRTAGPARIGDAVGRHVRDLHEQGRGRGSEPRLAAVRADAACPVEDPAVVLAGAPGRRDRRRPRRPHQGDAARGAPGAEAHELAGAHDRRRTAELRRPRRALRRDRREPHLGQGRRAAHSTRAARRRGADPRHGAATAARAEPAATPARACTSRASTTSWCGSRAAARRFPATRSWASSPVAAACRCTAPTARTR